MKFKVASVILALFSFIGFGMVIYSGFNINISTLICFVLYVLLPAYGSYGVFTKNRFAIIISVLFFASQSVRSVGGENLVPHISPISLALPFGDFSSGHGYLIDFFAIFMVLFLACLFKELITSSKVSQVGSK